MGPDADDPELTLEVFRQRISKHPGEPGSLLRNSRFVAGIGNAYSDEILWEARLALGCASAARSARDRTAVRGDAIGAR